MKKITLGLVVGFIAILLISSVDSAKAGEKKTLKMSSVWSAGIELVEIDKHFVTLVNELGGEEFQIKFFSGGEIVAPNELFNAVQTGTLDLGGDWGGYWAGKDEAFNIIGSHPMGLSATDYMIWIYQAGGLEVINEVYEQYNLVALPFGCHTSESGIRSHKPINSLSDYKGLKTRIGGKTQGQVIRELGGVQVMLAGSEVYQAMQKGVIDAVEYNVPTVDLKLGLDEVTEYWATPAWHAPSAIFSVMINKKVWENMSDREKSVMKTAAMANFLWSFTYFEHENISATEKFLSQGVEITRLSDEDLDVIQKHVNRHTMETAHKNPLFAKVALSQAQYIRNMAKWRSVSQPFSHGRNFEFLNIEKLKNAIK